MQIDAAQYLQVYDSEIIYSWSPREFQNFIKGSQLKKSDEYEMLATLALFNRYATNAKRPKLRDMFDIDKAKKMILNGGKVTARRINTELYQKAKVAMKKWKGGK